jgi:hypothetical protein
VAVSVVVVLTLVAGGVAIAGHTKTTTKSTTTPTTSPTLTMQQAADEYLQAVAPVNAAWKVFETQLGQLPDTATGPDLQAIATPLANAYVAMDQQFLSIHWPTAAITFDAMNYVSNNGKPEVLRLMSLSGDSAADVANYVLYSEAPVGTASVLRADLGLPPVQAPATTTQAPTMTEAPTTEPPTTYAPVPDIQPVGTFTGHLPRGAPGVVAVIAREVDEYGGVTLVVRNNTSAAVTDVEVAATATSPSGQVVGSGNTADGTIPWVMQPGDIGWGSIGLGAALPAGATLSFSVTSTPESQETVPPPVPVQVIQFHMDANGNILGLIRVGATAVNGPDVYALCLDSSGNPASNPIYSAVSPMNPSPGQEASFEIQTYPPCTSYLLLAAG